MLAGTPTNIVLGLIAGMTIFLGLPIARVKSASESLKGMLVLGSAGVLLFLIIEVGYHAIEMVEVTAKGGDYSLALIKGAIMVFGLALGLIGLAAIEEKRHQAKSGGASPLEIANMIAIGIGLHNFAEGLAIGQSYSSGNTTLGLVLVLGFALHNATEGFGIAGPLAGSNVSWAQLIGLGLIGGAPTAIGSALGGTFVNGYLELFILSLAVGSLIYVTRELLRLRFTTLGTTKAMTALTIGLVVGISTEIYIEAASVIQATDKSGAQANLVSTLDKKNDRGKIAVKQIVFDLDKAIPRKLHVARGENLLLLNKTTQPIEIEANGLISQEAFIPKHGQLLVNINGMAGQYTLSPEGSKANAQITVEDSDSFITGSSPEFQAAQLVAAITTIEGHVQAAYDLHLRALGNESKSQIKLDLARAGKHAHHPLHELLEGNEPKALAVQSALKKMSLLTELKENLEKYSQLAGNKETDENLFPKAYADLIVMIDKARMEIAGDAYSDPGFRAAVALIVLQQAEDEYREAIETGKFRVIQPAQPGKDGYLEYQDTRGFLKATRRLFVCPLDRRCDAAQAAIEKVLASDFRDVDPANPDRPIPFKEVEKHFEKIEKVLQRIETDQSIGSGQTKS